MQFLNVTSTLKVQKRKPLVSKASVYCLYNVGTRTPIKSSWLRKTLKSCSWQYWCKYILKLPDKTNSGALIGDTVHIILECLGSARHKSHYNKIVKNKDIFASKAIKRMVHKHIKRKNLNETTDLENIRSMALNGLTYDFFGKKYGEPTEVVSEKDFEIVVQEEGIEYKIKGFIDKLFIYGNHGVVLIRDFKTNKKKYEGKEVTDNLQDYMYTLAIRKLYPELKDQCLTVVGLGGAYGNTFIFDNDTKRYKKEDFVLKEKGVEPIIERHDFSVNKTFAVLNSSDKKEKICFMCRFRYRC